ncbi:MAG: hypothetical protein H7Y13_12055 [Sphingobacteriaceae bacterium]|nr:hypothetical protein [Sphingobacteriaceae bacterium]
MPQYQNISIPEETLNTLREALVRGDNVKIAERVGCTPDWVSKVLKSPSMATTHSNIVEEAVKLIDERKSSVTQLTNKIKTAVK